jgi:hypothetical protein
MFDKAKEKIKNWWANPYWAPVTEPLKYIGSAAYAPVSPFVSEIKHGWTDDSYKSRRNEKPKLVRILLELADGNNMGVNFVGSIGTGIGCLAAAFLAGAGAAAAGAAIPLIGLAAIAGGAVGVLATTPVVMSVLGLGGAIVGALATPYAVTMGGVKAFKHHQFQKTQAGLVQATPALQSAAPDTQEKAARIFTQLRDLPAELQAPVLKSLSESFAKTGTGAADSIMKSIEALPDADRKALVTELQKELATAFDAVATEQAQDSVVLQESASTMPALRFKKR